MTVYPPPPLDTTDAVAPRLNLGLRPLLLIITGGVLLGVFFLSLMMGSVRIPPGQIITVLAGGEAESRAFTNIVLKFRLPKAVTASLAGAALGVSGLMMQTYFRNALAGPFILGISSGASLGVALVVLATGAIGTTVLAGVGFAGDFALAAAAATGAGLTLAVVLLVASIVESRMTLLIVGLMLGYLTSAIVSLLLFFAVAERIQAYINWTFGSFGTVTWDQLRILAPAVTIGLVVSFAQMKTLNALLLGEHYAASMGLNLAGARFAVIAATALMAGAVTAFCGPIGFVGVAVPHLCRGLFTTSDHRLLLPGTAIIGAIVALVAALIAEVPGSSLVLPLNAVTALMGAPVVIWVIVRKRVIKAAI